MTVDKVEWRIVSGTGCESVSQVVATSVCAIGHDDRHRCPSTEHRLDFHSSAVVARNPVDDRQAEAAPSADGVAPAHELLRHTPEILDGNTDAAVGDGEGHTRRARDRLDSQLLGNPGMADRVVDEIVQQQFQGSAVRAESAGGLAARRP